MGYFYLFLLLLLFVYIGGFDTIRDFQKEIWLDSSFVRIPAGRINFLRINLPKFVRRYGIHFRWIDQSLILGSLKREVSIKLDYGFMPDLKMKFPIFCLTIIKTNLVKNVQ